MIGENSTLALECGVITHLTTKAFSRVDPNLLNPTKSQFIGVDGHFLSVEIRMCLKTAASSSTVTKLELHEAHVPRANISASVK